MKPGVLVVGVVLLLVGVVFGFIPQLSGASLTTLCTASPYKSVVFQGMVTDASTVLGVGAAVLVYTDITQGYQIGGGQTSSSGSYFILLGGTFLIYGCDSIGVEVAKPGSGYNILQSSFQLPDNSCGTPGLLCNSYTYSANYALTKTSGALQASFSYAVAGTTVSFTDLSTGVPNAWDWAFGDGGSSSAQNPSHTYANSGTYTVKLTIYRWSDATQASTTKDVSVTNPQQVVFAASFSYIATKLSVAFTDTTSGSPTSWLWNFGDGSTSTSQDPTHSYASAGTYTVTLSASRSSDGATSSAQSGVSVTSTSNTGGSATCTTNCSTSNNPPPSNQTCPQGYTGTYPTCYPSSSGGGLGAWNWNIPSVGFLLFGAGLMLAGVAIPGGKRP